MGWYKSAEFRVCVRMVYVYEYMCVSINTRRNSYEFGDWKEIFKAGEEGSKGSSFYYKLCNIT